MHVLYSRLIAGDSELRRRLDQVHEPKSPQEIVHQKRTGIDVLPFKSRTKQKMIWSCLYQIESNDETFNIKTVNPIGIDTDSEGGKKRIIEEERNFKGDKWYTSYTLSYERLKKKLLLEQ
ncbi:hypothetical protein TNCV_1515701 [Trichonephila clavipes]|nr:hypothetical protein TNCV_1515701 [Trichonephila clavipes]